MRLPACLPLVTSVRPTPRWPAWAAARIPDALAAAQSPFRMSGRLAREELSGPWAMGAGGGVQYGVRPARTCLWRRCGPRCSSRRGRGRGMGCLFLKLELVLGAAGQLQLAAGADTGLYTRECPLFHRYILRAAAVQAVAAAGPTPAPARGRKQLRARCRRRPSQTTTRTRVRIARLAAAAAAAAAAAGGVPPVRATSSLSWSGATTRSWRPRGTWGHAGRAGWRTARGWSYMFLPCRPRSLAPAQTQWT